MIDSFAKDELMSECGPVLSSTCKGNKKERDRS
jgi:hypothetical protein